MRLIIPGASGFIGKNLLLHLPKDWEITAIYNKDDKFPNFLRQNALENVIPFKCDLSRQSDVQGLFSMGNDFDLCVYLAALVNLPLSVKDPVGDLNINVVGLINFLEKYRGGKIIYMSSGAVYEGLSGNVYPGISLNPVLPYAISKMASEQYIKFYQHSRKTLNSYIILRFFGAYGPYEPPHKIYTKLVNAFCLENQNEFTLRGDGNNFIDAMYIDDAIDGLLKIINSRYENITVDFASCTPITLNELVLEAGKIFEKPSVEIKHVGETPEYISFKVSNDAMAKLFGFTTERTPLKYGLMKLADHLKRE